MSIHVIPAVPVGTAALIGPAVALNLWTFAIEGWMYATRIPAIAEIKKRCSEARRRHSEDSAVALLPELDSFTHRHKFDEMLEPSVRWKADNYNHLHEQPTVFYSIIGALALMGASDSTNIKLAWAYVGLRVVHSLVQVTTNPVPIRFLVFISSSAVLLGLTARTAALVF